MNNKIIEFSKELNIAKIGFTNITDYSYLKDVFEYRFKNKYDCEFEANDIDRRMNVLSIFPECKSIITAIFPYAQGYKMPSADDMGNLSVSSFNIDYHKKVYDKLEKLSNMIKKIKDFNYKICVDTTPLIDRAICKNSGLGYIGKNNMLINNEYGSFIFLGYILTDLELEVDNTIHAKDLCGNCNICKTKCPNYAINNSRSINTKRCVSYLTQTKEYIPIEFRKAMGKQIYGCDVCQINCPKNNRILEQSSNQNYNNLLVDLKQIMSISNVDFKNKYGIIAGAWRGKNIWKRNAIIASANLQINSMYDLIKNELENQSDMIKIYASWAILEISRERSKDFIFNKIKYENETIQKEYKKLLEVKNE